MNDNNIFESNLIELEKKLSGELFWDEKYKAIYATDASVYRKIPLAVAHPKNEEDLKTLVHFANQYKTSLIARTAGTSLAGQCVGEGIIVDTSRYLNKIIELDVEAKTVTVQPGVNRDQLNQYLGQYQLFFPPETATANRAMIGGMVGNNSCGANSIVYGSTRDYVLEISGILSDGSPHTFKASSYEAIPTNPLVKKISQQLVEELAEDSMRQEIRHQYPKPQIHRRNTGYAVDLVLNEYEKGSLDFTKMICGSEGTLMIITSIKLKVVAPPPPCSIMLIPHFHDIHECMRAVLVIMEYKPYACELMDRIILNCTDGHDVYKQYKFFVQGDPEALLMVELRGHDQGTVDRQLIKLRSDLESKQLGYAYAIVESKDHKKIWDLRKAGLGLLANMPGDKKAIECIEDTAVALEDLPDYIRDFSIMMTQYGQTPLYYAHAGAGEIHLRPVLNMHDAADRKLFRSICEDSARLVKKYQGSLSGEHGDGRLRGEFIPLMLGDKIYALLKRIKATWDPNHIFNPGKITDAPKIDVDLRYDHEKAGQPVDTIFDFDQVGGFYHAAARCSGSADCRKQASIGGTMCPSFMATLNEKDSTRARANALKEFYSDQSLSSIKNMEEVKEVLDLCLSCKGCHNECPSNVDMTILKSEFMHQYYNKKGIPLRARLVGNIERINEFNKSFPFISNWGQNLSLVKKYLGIHIKRQLPEQHKFTFRYWSERFLPAKDNSKTPVLFFIDEFSNYYDVEIAIKAVTLLDRLGYPVKFIQHAFSGRAQFSKGLLSEALQLAQKNIGAFTPYVADYKIVGLEPSAILSFRDEYPKLMKGAEKSAALRIAENVYTIEEFLYQEAVAGHIHADLFDMASRTITIHAHCHQKALSKTEYTAFILGLPAQHKVSVIPSGCCGMAGSFGYETEHYDLSMKIGELVLFPAIRSTAPSTYIAAAGTSCRHQITDGTGRKALHPVEILWEALVK